MRKVGAQLAPERGRLVQPDNLHITLLFLGNVDWQTIDALCIDCDTITAPPFSLTIDHAGWWSKPKLYWLAPEQNPPALMSLVSELNKAAKRRKLITETRKYFPHITLMRKVDTLPAPPHFTPFTWPAKEYCLMQSITRREGAQYVELARWTLRR